MALALYSDTFWFPNGILAANVEAVVFSKGNSAPASLFADAAGAVPISNPTSTNGAGVLTFYAAVGEYWIHLDTETFLVDVGMSQEQADLSTGIASGGQISPSASDSLSIDINPFIGYISSVNQVGPGAPSIIRVDFPATTVQLDAAAQTRGITWWLVDGNQNVIQQATIPTNEQFRSHIVLGASFLDLSIGQIDSARSLPVILPQTSNQLNDLMVALGSFSVSGNQISPNGANLSINKASGIIFARAFNHYVSGILTNNPHTAPSPALTVAPFRRVIRGFLPSATPIVTTLDPANYDLNGVLTPVGGGVNTSTIQRVYLFANDNVNNRLVIQYGQNTYSSLAAAVDAVGAGTFVPTQVAATGALIGWIAVTRAATNLSDPTQATFIHAGKFATP